MKNKLMGLLIATSLIGSITARVARAQDTTEGAGTGTGTTNSATQDRHDDSSKWGWLGLLGLVGLLGLRRPAPTVVGHSSELGARPH